MTSLSRINVHNATLIRSDPSPRVAQRRVERCQAVASESDSQLRNCCVQPKLFTLLHAELLPAEKSAACRNKANRENGVVAGTLFPQVVSLGMTL